MHLSLRTYGSCAGGLQGIEGEKSSDLRPLALGQELWQSATYGMLQGMDLN